jgi:hypothetical protein
LGLAGLGERYGLLKSCAGLGDALSFQPFVSAPTGDADDDKEAAANDIVAVALPQLFKPFATNFFVDFMKNIGHTLPRPAPRLQR